MGYVHVPSLAPSLSVLGTGQQHCGTSAAEMKMPTADSCQPLHFDPHLHLQRGLCPGLQGQRAPMSQHWVSPYLLRPREHGAPTVFLLLSI